MSKFINPAKVPPSFAKRILLVFDGSAWYVRRVRIIEHDTDMDEKVYRCDEHMGGPFTLAEGMDYLQTWAEEVHKLHA